MNIKFNWGTGIFIFIVLFIMSMISVIIFSFNQQVNLVTPEYYPKGVLYQDHITKIKNASLLKDNIRLDRTDGKITLGFPDEFSGKSISGTVQFYYVTDFEKDSNFKIKLDKDLKQDILTTGLVRGRYLIKIDWQDGEKAYFQEIALTL